MKNKIILFLSTALFSITGLASCNLLHVHDYSAQYQFNETEHWQVCTKCGGKINLETHYFNQFNDECLICKYKDPVVTSNESKHMTGLTPHGKTKVEVTVPEGITFIDTGAFKDSQASTVNLKKDIVGIYKGAFEGSKVTIVNTEEEAVNWIEYNGIYFKDDILKNYEALISDGYHTKTYAKLEDAFNDVTKDGTTITILKENVEAPKPIQINHTVTLESYHSECKLISDFNIQPNGWIIVPPSIKYQGNVKLLLAETTEELLRDFYTVYSSGTIAFAKTAEKPANVNVYYVNSFEEEENLKKVKGAAQVINEALIVPTDYYVYGTFLMDKSFENIMGLTQFAKKINTLTINGILDDDSKMAHIHDRSFVVGGRVDIDIGIKKIVLRADVQKGGFHDLIIGDRIDSIGLEAFTTRVSHDVSPEFRKEIAALTSPLYTVHLGDSVTSIGTRAFADCESLTDVIGGNNLTTIGEEAFSDCGNLKNINLSTNLALTDIRKNAFAGCGLLKSVIIPADGWAFDGHGYLPGDMTAENTALYLNNYYKDKNWHRTIGGNVCYYDPNKKDADGRYNEVHYVSNFNEALNSAKDNNHIFLMNTEANKELKDININKHLRLTADPNLNCNITGNLTIEKNSYLLIPENVNVENANITLKRESTSGNDFKKLGGLGIKRAINNALPTVNYDNGGEANHIAGKMGGEEYYIYGGFDFSAIDGEGYGHREHILCHSDLGRTLTKVEITNQRVEKSEKTRYVYIQSKAFYQEKNLYSEVVFLDNVLHVSEYAFENMESLKKLVIGKSLDWIDTKAFFKCYNLETVDISKCEQIKYFGENCFAECRNLKRIELNKNVKLPLEKIASRAFEKSGLEYFDLAQQSTDVWKHNGTSIDSSVTTSPTEFASYLREKYPTHNFTRG